MASNESTSRSAGAWLLPFTGSGRLLSTLRGRLHRPGTGDVAWGRGFDPVRLARLELRMWQAYYRRQPVRLFGLLVLANREQARLGWPRAVVAAAWLARGAAGFGRSTGDYDRFLPDIERGYRALGIPATADVAEVARRELRWWVVRREIGLSSGETAGASIAALYAALYRLPAASVAEAGRLRGMAAEVRDRGASADPDGPAGPGRAYWPEVGRLLRDSYRSLRLALDGAVIVGEERGSTAAGGDRRIPAGDHAWARRVGCDLTGGGAIPRAGDEA